MSEFSIWNEFDKLHVNFDNEKQIDDYVASMEKFNLIRFHRENHVFRIGHFGGRVIELDKKMQLPTGAIVHLLDNLEYDEWIDTPRVNDNELLQRESYRKFLFHVRDVNLSGPVKMEDKFIFRPAGLPSVLMKFRSTQGNAFRYVNQLRELPTRMESLCVINHNPLFRIKLFGRMQYFRRIQLILTSVLNTCCQIAEEHKANKQQYIFLPWSEAIFDKSMFIRSRKSLNIQSIKRPESAHYIVMMHILNFLWHDAETSLFKQLPEEVLSKINLVLKHNDKYIFYNLQDLVKLNVSQTTYLKCANHLNLLAILGKKDPEKTTAEQIILDTIRSENKTTEEEIKETVDNNTSIDQYPDADVVEEVLATSVDDDFELQEPEVVEAVIEKVAREISVKKVVKTANTVDVKLTDNVLPLTSNVIDSTTETPVSKILVNKSNATSIKNKAMDLNEEVVEYIKELDVETEAFIESKTHLTPKEKQRMSSISKKYKSLTIDGESLENIMKDDNDISLTIEPLDAKILGVVPDPSALTSSLSDFDKAYQKKTFKKHLVSTITSFQKNGVYLTDVKEEKIVSEMNNLTIYTCKYTDIDNKQSTIKFRIPTVDSEGRIMIDGVKQVLKKQRVTLPIVKINEQEVSLASNQNKTRVMRNTNRAHSFGAYIESMLASEKSNAETTFGSNKVNLPLPYEYSILADKYTAITFNKNKDFYYLWFDYNNRLTQFDDKEDLLVKLEAEYGVYLGKTDKHYIFIDQENKVYFTLHNGSESLEDHPDSIFEILKLSLKEGVSVPKPLSEWVSIKILDKQLPVMFVLAYRFGLRHMLDYIGLDYVVTERRTKTIVSENTKSVGPKTVPGMESYISKYNDFTIENSKVSELSKEDRSYIEKMEKQLRLDQLKYMPDEVRAVWREIGETAQDGIDNTSRYTIARNDKEIIGFTSFNVKDKIIWLHQLFVDPKSRGKGLGSILLDTALKHAKRFHSGEAKLNAFYGNTNAIDMYSRRGFIVNRVFSTCMQKNIRGKVIDDYQISNDKIPVITVAGMTVRFENIKNKVLYLETNLPVIPERLDDLVETISDIGNKFKMVYIDTLGDQKLPKHYNKQSVTMSADLSKIVINDKSVPGMEELHDFLPEIPKSEESKYYYHISLNDLGSEYEFTPRVPGTMISEMEDTTIPRICVSTSIEGAILANPYLFVNPEIAKADKNFRTKLANCWVYAIPRDQLSDSDVVSNKEIVDRRLVFDAHITDEVWIIKNTTLRNIGKIRVSNNTQSKDILFEPLIYRDHNELVDKYANANLKRINYLEELQELGLQPDEYIIGASACAMLYGYPKEANDDLDICITQKAFDRIRKQLTETDKGFNYKHVDVSLNDPNSWFSFEKYGYYTWNVRGYTFLSPYGTCMFYKELYSISKLEKHQKTMEWCFHEIKASRIDTYLFPHKWIDGPYLDETENAEPMSLVKRIISETEDIEVDSIEISSDRRYQVKPGDIQIKFADRTLWINRYPLAKSLIVAGLEYFDLSAYEMSEFESPDVYFKLLQDKRLSTNYLKGINSFFDAFIDPMTYTTLKMMKEPTTVKDLLLRSSVLLSTLDHRPASSRENHRIRGYEQFNAILYNEMARQFATYRSKQGKAKVFSINPDAVFLRIIQNASMVTSETVNPLQDMKEQAYLTYSGIGGRTADSFVLNDRRFANDDVGIISEATPDNQKVGINAQLSANPGVVNTMGVLEPASVDKLEPANILSIHSLMFPFSTNDDAKRMNFQSIQSSHWVPTTTTDHSRVKTGYERAIAHRIGRDFAGIASEDGIVSNVDTKTKMIEVTYSNGDVDIFPYGENYVEYQGFHVTQEIETIVEVGQKIKKGDVVTYNKGYFNLDPSTKQLDMTLGVQANVVLMETDGTLEDSAEISKELSEKLSMKPTHTRMVTLTNSTIIWNSLKVGDEVLNTDALMVFEEDMIGSAMPTDDPEAIRMLSELNRKTPTAKFSGSIVKMEVFYGGEIADMHPSLQAIVKPLVDAKNREYRLANKTMQAEKYPPSGKIPKGSKYKGIMFDETTVCIQFYIQETIKHAQGDKLVLSTVLKATCSDVTPQPVHSESGVKVDMIFSCSAMGNRIVLSPVLTGMSARIMEKIENDVVDMYFDSK